MTNQLQGVSAEMSNKILNYVNAKAKTPNEKQGEKLTNLSSERKLHKRQKPSQVTS